MTTATVMTQFFDSAEQGVPGNYSRCCDGTGINYRLDVLATSVADVVRSASGWLYDRRAAGWEVNVFVPPGAEPRPLRILGVQTWDLDSAPLSDCLAGHELAVSASVCAADARIRARVSDALAGARPGVTLWGAGWPLPVERAVHDARYRLSGSARAFKRHALAAAGLTPGVVGEFESFLSDMRAGTSVESDLIPLAR